jgi:hypothetical protein
MQIWQLIIADFEEVFYDGRFSSLFICYAHPHFGKASGRMIFFVAHLDSLSSALCFIFNLSRFGFGQLALCALSPNLS